MLGAVIGDIVGSIYEGDNLKSKDFPLFSTRFGRASRFTDDTVTTMAVARGLLDGGTPEAFVNALKQFGNAHPNVGYGGSFRRWLASEDSEPYNSWGNGSAMRVSPCAWYATSLDEAERLAEISALVTHNHPEGIKGAKATAAAIYLAREGKSKDEIRDYIEAKYGYDLHRKIDEIRPGYEFDVSCQGSIPEAITAFLESSDFEDAIRNAISLGGDSDTIAAIAGSIAEAAYGIPNDLREKALDMLDTDLTDVLTEWFGAGHAVGQRSDPPSKPASDPEMTGDVSALKAQVQKFLADNYSGIELNDDGFAARNGSSYCFIEFEKANDEAPAFVVLIFGILQNLTKTPALLEWIAEHGNDFRFGGYYFTDQDDGKFTLYLRQSIWAEPLNESELETAINWMANCADDLDDELQLKFGGTRFVED